MPSRSATSLATMAMLVWACLVLGVSSSRSAAGSGLAKQQAEASASSAAVAESFTASLGRSLQWWKDPLGVGGDDEDDEDDDDRRNDDDDDDVKDDNDDNDQCAEREERSRECGASDSFPRKCCGSLVCDGTRCRREGDIEDDEKEEEETQVKACADPGERSQACGGGGATPETCCGANTCNMETNRCEALECSLLGMRSQQCGGGGALPVTCCGDLVCNGSNRCDDPANAGNAQDDAPITDDGEEDADLTTCASDGDRAIECGATNPSRPQKCCPGHICSSDASFFARCVKDPTSGGTPGTDVPVTPDIPLTPAPTPAKMTGEPTMGGATLEPTGAGKCCALHIKQSSSRFYLFVCE